MKLTKLDADRYFINLCRANERIEIQYWIFTLALDFSPYRRRYNDRRV